MPQAQEENITSVEIANPTLNTVKDEYIYSGTIQAAETVDVSAKVSGTVSATYYEVGDKVSKGAVLYKIDDTDYQNNLKSAQASLNSANAGVQSAKTGVDTANGATMESQLTSAKNTITNAQTALDTANKSLDDAKIALDKAQSDYDINKQLNEIGGVSDDTLNTYKNTLDNAQNSYTTY
ncbi:MAG: biotin/lipoyl-binding protein [Lachnospirales bacterium]